MQPSLSRISRIQCELKRYTYLNGTIKDANDAPKRIGEHDITGVCANTTPVNDNAQGGYDRCAVFLDESTAKIVVMPSINGNVEKYKKFKKYMLSFKNPKNIVFVFSPGIWQTVEVLRLLVLVFLELGISDIANLICPWFYTHKV